MSRSAAATTAGRQRSLPRSPAPRHPRRVSGPARAQVSAPGAVAYPRPQRLPARPPLRVVAGGAAIASRVAGVALDVSGSRAMDRLVRSRAWIVIVAFGLIGIVAMQVSMLKLNAGIGRAVETVSTLERTNALLRGDLSRLSDGSRIQTLAGARGYVMPAPADVTYLRAGDLRADGARAAHRMIAPNFALAGPAGATTVSPAEALAAPAAQTAGAAAPATAPVASQTSAPAAAPLASQTSPPATATTPPVAVTPAPTGGAAPAAAAPAASQSAGGMQSAGGAAPAVGGVGGP